MTSTCTITRVDGERVFDEETGTYTDPPLLTVYSGPCKLQDSGRAVGDVEVAERQVGIVSTELHLPVTGSEDVRRNDVATIDSNPFDPAVVGRRFVVQAPHGGTLKTARRLPVEAVA